MGRRLLLVAVLGAALAVVTVFGLLAASSADARRPVGPPAPTSDAMYALVRQMDGDLYKEGHQVMPPDGIYRLNWHGMWDTLRKHGFTKTVAGLHMMSASTDRNGMCDGCRFYPGVGERCFDVGNDTHCAGSLGQPGICRCTCSSYDDNGGCVYAELVWLYPCF